MIFGRLLCVVGWHNWDYSYNLKRRCFRCGLRQIFTRVGNMTGWMNV